MKSERLRVLSLDAGGVKGIYSALIISGIGKRYNINFNLDIDQYVGTSIGAVLSTALAYGIPIEDILNKFYELAGEMHKGHVHLTNQLFQWLDYLFGHKRLGNIKPKLFIPLYNLTLKKPTYCDNYSEFDKYKISDVLKAACSDIRIMQGYKFQESNHLFADAGIFAYDPILFFLRQNETLLSRAEIISIGSGLISNIASDINKSELFDLIYDSFLHDQFITTNFFFNNTKGVKYLRISEYPLINSDDFSFDDIKNIVNNRLIKLEYNHLANSIL